VARDLPERRGKGMGGEWRAEKRWGRSRGFYTSTVDTVRRGIDRHGLGGWAVFSGRRCDPGPVV
jgi:hypothetical protein